MPVHQKIPAEIARAAARLPAARAEAARLGLPLTADALRTKPPVPDAQNAAPLYRRIMALLEAERKREKGIPWYDFVRTRSPRDRAAAQAAVKRLAPVLSLARQAAALPRCDFAHDWERGGDLTFPESTNLGLLSHLQAAQALLQMDAYDPLAAAETLRIATTNARHPSEPIFVTFARRVTAANLLTAPFADLLNRFGERADVLEAVTRANNSGESPTRFTWSLRGEIWFALWSFEEYRKGRRGATLMWNLGKGSSPSEVPADAPPPVRRIYADAWEARLLEAYNPCVVEERKTGSSPRLQFLGIQRQMEELERRYKAGDTSYLFAVLLQPFLVQALVHLLRELTEIRLRRVAISAMKWRLQTGQYPEALPYADNDPFTDRPLIYRRHGADGFEIYSVGPNRRDDNGDTSRDTGSRDFPQYPKDIGLIIHRIR